MSRAAVVVIVVGIIGFAFVVAAFTRTSVRRRHLPECLGPEYDRMVSDADGTRRAERELAHREKRHRKLDPRPLDRPTRERYAGEWATVHERFVDSPRDALTDANALVTAVMRERGYPTGGVPPATGCPVRGARAGPRPVPGRARDQRPGPHRRASTEDIRQAIVHYGVLFEHPLDMSTQRGSPGHRNQA